MNAPLKTTAEAATDFVRRHIGPSPRDVAAMLQTVGAKNLAELMSQTLPASIRQKAPLDLGRALKKAEAAAVVESVKAASDVYAPISGEVLEVNEAITSEPALVNTDAGGAAWFFKLRIADQSELGGLMDEAAYKAHTA